MVKTNNFFNHEKFLSVNSGFHHNLVQTENKLYSFGYNNEGTLFDDSTLDKLIPNNITN